MNTLDLFVGAGGLSEGFSQAGFTVSAGVDFDEEKLETFQANHEGQSVCRDLFEYTPEEFESETGIAPEEIDGIIGGPPCKGFSLAGKRDTSDERNHLVYRFLEFVEYYNPSFIVIENVKGMVSMEDEHGDEVLPQVITAVEELGYIVSWDVLNASYHGVPQTRERVFIVGIQEELDIDFEFPVPEDTQTTVEDTGVFTEPLPEDDVGTNHQSSTVERLEKLDVGESMYDNYSESWKRIAGDEPAPTLKNNNNAPFVHPWEPRVGTIRECARIQSFPEEYKFKGTKSKQYEILGNAVPVELARRLGVQVATAFDVSVNTPSE